MTNISVIILVGREALHIGRCLERLAPLAPRQVFVVESQTGDRTHEIAAETAKSLGWSVQAKCSSCPMEDVDTSALQPSTFNLQPVLSLIWHDWPGVQSTQFNWTLENCPIEGEWVLRLDADEYLTDEGIAWLKAELAAVPPDVAALELTLERKFCGGVIRHATNGIRMVRMYRRGKGRYAETEMDERIEVDGKVLSVPVVFFDDNLNGMDWWREKHRGYAKREARQALESLRTGEWTDPRKAKYYRLPRYLRAFAYFAVRYFLKGGFLDGYAGWMWNYWQGLWYRLLVDRELIRQKSKSP